VKQCADCGAEIGSGDDGPDCRPAEPREPNELERLRHLDNRLEEFLQRAAKEPIGVDISDFGDEWCAGFLRGQVNVLEELARCPRSRP
jgi:hypothetical protein